MVSFDFLIARYVEACNNSPEKSEVDCLWEAVLNTNDDLYYKILTDYPDIYDETSFFKLIKQLQKMWH